MTGKIIIDNIDVSGCIYFRMNNKMPMCRACNSGVGSPYCEYHKDCYYKQLKRAEQKLAEKDKEIERLKQGIKHYQRGMFSIINTATECRNNKKWNYKE